MSDQKIAGYRPITPEMQTVVNENKLLEELVLRQIDRHASNPDYDQRWVALAKTQIQKGFMDLNRAVFQPARITPNISQLEKFEDDTIVLMQKLVR